MQPNRDYINDSEQATDQSVNEPVVTMREDEAPQNWEPSQPSEAPDLQAIDPEEVVRWQATEHIQREKNPLWYVVFGIVVLLLMAAALYFKEFIFAVLVPVMAASLFMYVRRPPRIINYTLSRKGLYVNDELYPFVDFKAFGVIQDNSEYSVFLIPVKRFRPGITVFFPQESGEAIVDMLGARLPMQKVQLDLVDRLLRKLRI